MIRFVMLATLLAGCRISLESDTTAVVQACEVKTVQSCMDATSHSDLAWIQANIFTVQCAFSGCHDGGNSRAGKIDLRDGHAHDHLVGFASGIEPSRSLVVPNDLRSSYLMLMLQDFPPEEATPPGSPPPDRAGFMPMSNDTLCCQKLGALERWITAGAPNN